MHPGNFTENWFLIRGADGGNDISGLMILAARSGLREAGVDPTRIGMYVYMYVCVYVCVCMYV